MSGTTEEKIISSIPDLDDNTDEGNETEAQTNDTEAEASTAATAEQQQVDAVGSDGSGENPSAQPPAATNEAAPIVRRDGLLEKPSTTNPGARDLVDPATGQVVARGGIERRIFEGAQRVHRENQQLQQRITVAEGNANLANDIVKLGTTLNLSANDQRASLQLMSQFLKNPVQMLEQLVIEVKSKGYDIPFLTNGITPGMDTAAIQRMVEAKMQPITQQRQQQEDAQKIQVEAKKTLDTFLDANPEGQHNLTVLAEMMTAQPGLSIDHAYMKMIKWAASSGLDYTQPLKQQIEARAKPVTQVAQIPETPRQPVVPLPMGRQTNSAAPINTAAKFDENARWEDIIRQSMRETGMSA